MVDTYQQNINFLTVQQKLLREKQYLQAFTNQQEILSILTNSESS